MKSPTRTKEATLPAGCEATNNKQVYRYSNCDGKVMEFLEKVLCGDGDDVFWCAERGLGTL